MMSLNLCCSLSLCQTQGGHATSNFSSRKKKKGKGKEGIEKVKEAVNNCVVNKRVYPSNPQRSLENGNWVKLICGASFQDVVDIRNLSLVYTLAGVDCIDCAADESVVSAVNEGIDAAREIVALPRPWVMISVNDEEDLHFRKAEFDPEECPLDCSRPCEIVCPANAISIEVTPSAFKGGVIMDRCYGCGRCLPVCPYDRIRAPTYIRDASATAQLLQRNDVDAVEIHSSGRQTERFEELWSDLGDSVEHVKLVAVSLPYCGDTTLWTIRTMYSIMEPKLCCLNLWQLDGRPMSGDIGRGATKEAIAFAARMASETDMPHGFLQLAGGTNAHTVEGLKREGLFQARTINTSSEIQVGVADHAIIGGVAYGGYARKIVGRVLSLMQSENGVVSIEDYPKHLLMALTEALSLVGSVKCYDPSTYSSVYLNDTHSLCNGMVKNDQKQ